jgi:peptide/nickel transport system substrate-binding protein
MGVNQADYMVSVTGGDATAYRTCKSMFPCGSRYGQEIGSDVMRGDVGKASAMLRASGYSGEKAVLLNPTDLTTIGQLGNVTYDLLRKIGMNVEMVATDSGTMLKRRASRQPVEKGGWSVLHTWGPSTIRYTPVENSQIRGLGTAGWFGWYKDDTIEMLTRRFVEAVTAEERNAIALQIHRRAFEMVPCIPLGMFQIRTAYRASLTGVVSGTGPYFWNVRRV